MNGSEDTNDAPSSGWMAVKKLFFMLSVFATVIVLMITGGKFFKYIDALGYSDEKSKLYDLFVWVVVAVIVFWTLNKSMLMGGVDRLSKSMHIEGFFNPEKDEQATLTVRASYFGIDFETGVIGVVSPYKTQENSKKIIYFEDNLIESYDYNKDHLILNLRCRKIPTLTIPVPDGQKMFRKIEQLSKYVSSHSNYRELPAYQNTKKN